MNVEALVKKIAAEVTRRMQVSRKIVYVMDDQDVFVNELLQQTSTITDGTASLQAIVPERIKTALQAVSSEWIFYDDTIPDQVIKVIEEADVIAAPLVTLSTIAKASQGIELTSVDLALGCAFRQGKSVLLNIEGCLPMNPAGTVSNAYLEMIIGHLRVMRSFGCELTIGKQFINDLSQKLYMLSLKHDTELGQYLSKPLITAADIVCYPANDRIVIDADSRLTTEALQAARDNNIMILQRVV